MSDDEDMGDDVGGTYELPEASRKEQAAQERLIQELELKQKMKAVVVPTDDKRVRAMLRQLGEPVTLFGERELERRERCVGVWGHQTRSGALRSPFAAAAAVAAMCLPAGQRPPIRARSRARRPRTCALRLPPPTMALPPSPRPRAEARAVAGASSLRAAPLRVHTPRRLQKQVATRGDTLELADLPVVRQIVVEAAVATQREVFYTEGPPALAAARAAIAAFSLPRAAARLAAARAEADTDAQLAAAAAAAAAEAGSAASAVVGGSVRSAAAAAALSAAARMAQQTSEIADERPVSGCAFSPDGGALATCGWGGLVSVWGLPGCRRLANFRSHEDRCTGAAARARARKQLIG